MNKNTFKDLFIELESAINKSFPYARGGIFQKIEFLKSKRINPFYKDYEFLCFCRKYRNLTSHNDGENSYLDFTDKVIEKLKQIVYETKNPYRVIDKAIKPVECADINAFIRDKMKLMKEKCYTHLPIYNNSKLIGVFSETTMFNYAYDKNIFDLNDKKTFNDIIDYIKISKVDKLGIIKIEKSDKLYDYVVNDFIDEYNKHQKLSCVLITKDGTSNEPVEGILTSWDIIGK